MSRASVSNSIAFLGGMEGRGGGGGGRGGGRGGADRMRMRKIESKEAASSR